jgi:hypothetical protein
MIVLVLIALLAVCSTAAATPMPTRIAETIVATWRCQDKIRVAHTRAYSPWKPHSRGFRAAQLNLWKGRLHGCRAVVAERARQWHWEAWLPDKWRRVGMCETGLNWRHANSQYVSAFGISVREYDNDAAYMGVRGWYVKGRPAPSPWEQYQAALGHYRRFGGFSGWGCRGA